MGRFREQPVGGQCGHQPPPIVRSGIRIEARRVPFKGLRQAIHTYYMPNHAAHRQGTHASKGMHLLYPGTWTLCMHAMPKLAGVALVRPRRSTFRPQL